MVTRKTLAALLLIHAVPIAAFAAGAVQADTVAYRSKPISEPDTTLGVVIVTANKRKESLQKVATSISVVSGAALQRQRIQNFAGLQSAVAGLVVIPGGGDEQFLNMRGTFTARSDSPAQESPVSVFVDGVATSGAEDLNQRLFDISRVEVLTGPQGTEFGKNTIGGVISIHTKRPSFTPDVQMSATAGNLGLTEFQGLVTGPLNNRVAAILSVYANRRDGNFRDPTIGDTVGAQRAFGFRGQVLAKVTDKFKVLTGVDYLEDNSDSPPGTNVGDGFFPPPNSPVVYGITPSTSLTPFNPRAPHREISAFVRAQWDLDFATLTSITGYRHSTTHAENDFLGDPLGLFHINFDSTVREGTEEVRLVSPGDLKFTWLTGLYASSTYNDRTTHVMGYGVGLADSGPQLAFATSDAKSVAAYAEAGYKFTDTLKLVVGDRFTYDHKTGKTDFIGAIQGGIDNVFIHVPLGHNWNGSTPKVTLEYTPTKVILLYTTVSRGYVGGGFESQGAGITPGGGITLDQAIAANVKAVQHPYAPEYATNYEVGAKTSWLDDRLVANLDIYRENFTNLQVTINNSVGGIIISTPGNAGRTRSQGLDLELHAAPVSWLRLGATYSYSNDRYLEFETHGVSRAGNYLPFTPINSLNLSMEGNWLLPNGWGAISVSGDVTYRSRIWGDEKNADPPQVHDWTGIKGLANASIDYMAHSGHWDLRLWARNLTDLRYNGRPSNLLGFARAFGYNGTYFSAAEWNPPRTFGLTASYHLR